MPIIINNQTIDKISGPVSIYVLKPKETYFRDLKKNDVYAPIFMLFGDEHFSLEGLCEPCEDSSTCYVFYKERFLKLIDSLAEPEYPIDFFIEGVEHATEENYEKEEAVDVMDNLRDKFRPCFKRQLRGTQQYKELCPTENIRWHSGDARYWYTNNYNFEYFIFTFFKLMGKIGELMYTNRQKYTVTQFYSVFYEAFKNSELDDKDIKSYLNIIMNHGIFTDEFNKEWLDDNNVVNKSVIKKQLKKVLDQLEPELKQRFNSKWYKWINEYVHYMMHERESERNQLMKSWFKNYEYDHTENIKRLAYCIYHMIDKDNTEREIWIENNDEINKKLDYFFKNRKLDPYWFHSSSILLDIYILLRTFKKPEGIAKNSLISLCYFGNFHVKNIVYFLTHIMKAYTIELELSNDKQELSDKKCLVIDKNININDIVQYYKNL